ncbi:conserved hypothetical protein [Dinoroseobacter shibae DFL 12 = DSM 16493]|jgi:uncharacterized protein (TIGR02186 family)|uniref:Transmembrane protein n=1 Tax=Dinoroseobacter shibae (strain DSM 16493 / NCIMB 14021 / DFL 12) TaxID=398580 RepID=A8LJ86_DINSH|nr:TIGR02186 family protein [Dinoroseobacter shibae]ABV94581.1 conserved hypothetical protein [Dinoroseobacter shibae DFL 12 = DSM 16493]URF46007.1 TIGR02186 family protein [Dinoroseobacter shibae]URF50313.1 TIGR02186 family protein [Dinoroseobacter shibae]
MIRLAAALLLLLVALPLRAEEVVADLSQTRVAITANFDGSEILIFGAVKRESPIPPANDLGVIIAVEGPPEPVTIRRKSRVAGIWVNTAAAEIDAAPTFYAVATSAPLRSILSETEDLRHRITTRNAIRAIDSGAAEELDLFTDALVRIRASEDLYQTRESAVVLRAQTLFSTEFTLPANLTEGSYRTRIFLTRDRQVIDAFETAIDVRKVGLERWIYNLAHDRPLIYGMLSIAIAIAAGWSASAVFRYIRG